MSGSIADAPRRRTVAWIPVLVLTIAAPAYADGNVALLALATAPAGERLGDAPSRDEGSGEERGEGERPGESGDDADAAREAAPTPSLDFDLLGAPAPPPPAVDVGALRLRRQMLTVHQGIGIGLVGLQLATTVVGQLNYSDKYDGGPATARYQLSHKTLAYTTLGLFAVNGLIALFAPSPVKAPRQLDRVMVHRIAMLAATLGMVAQGVLGIYTRERVGYVEQERLARTHLIVGYGTLAAMLVGVGVFLV